MKTVYGPICDGCESVRHCSRNGCIPIRTEDGGEQVDTDCPSMFASRWFWASAVVCACLWSAVAFLK